MSDVTKELNKIFGDSVKTKNQKTAFFDSGYPPLNKIISGRYDGGVPSGRIIEISGASQTGKTLIAVEIAISVQQMGGAVLFVDFERRFNIDFATERGLNPESPYFFWLKGDTWENGVAWSRKWTQFMRKQPDFPIEVPLLIIFDSVAAAVPLSKMDEKKLDTSKYSMNDAVGLAKVISQTIPLLNQNGDNCNASTLLLNQIRESPGVSYGNPTTIPGGKAIGFYSDVRLELTKSQEKDGKDIVGQKVNCKATKCLTSPNGKTSWVLKFLPDGRTVLDYEVSLVEHAIEIGVIQSPTQGYYTWEGLKLRKKEIVDRVKAENKRDFLIEDIKASEIIR